MSGIKMTTALSLNIFFSLIFPSVENKKASEVIK